MTEKIPQPRQLSLAQKYDVWYGEGAQPFSDMPEELVLRGGTLLSRGSKVLELGAGYGRNAIALAQMGMEVKAVDISKAGISRIEEEAQRRSLENLTAHVGDARDIEGKYDMIVSTFMLHHLGKEEGQALIRKMQEHTNEDGFNALAVFGNRGDFAELKGDHFYPASDDLKHLYTGWEIIECVESIENTAEKRPDGEPQVNLIITLLAKKTKK